ncbi:hypothetical protein [Marinobacter sp. CA1]|uniref:hypothetical protein n=1 Tax=Marinobacter sp. CA1 TaxID=2817656 RepID=UPI001D070F0D|nr:hypothetical protein [Marinobacter sp. CA1]UDL05724.1 hypothetical protein J2887_02845 [Marinobacter sp. CA1]
MKVSLSTCEEELFPLLSQAGWKELERWEQRRPEKVVRFAKGFAHEFLFKVRPEDVLAVVDRTAHALGDVHKSEALPEIEDYSAPFAFQDIFHACLEEKETVPTWEQFREWFAKERRDLFVEDYLKDINPGARTKEEKRRLKRALKWRLGKAYYSSLREVHLLASLRHTYGLDVKYHVLADVRLRVDFWMGNQVIICYFSNQNYRAGTEGRKPRTQGYFRDNAVGFHSVAMYETEQYGRAWLVSNAEIERLADCLHSDLW